MHVHYALLRKYYFVVHRIYIHILYCITIATHSYDVLIFFPNSLDAATGQPIAINSTFESVMGPLYKFNEWEFANAASDDEELPPTADGRKRKHINENRTKFRSAINEVRDSINNNNNSGSSSGRIRNIEMLTLSSDNSGLPVRKFFDWTIGSVQNSSHSTIILYGDVVNEVESSNR